MMKPMEQVKTEPMKRIANEPMKRVDDAAFARHVDEPAQPVVIRHLYDRAETLHAVNFDDDAE